MTDKDLILKLNSLKNIGPEAAWQKQNRDLLLSQISNSGACELSVWKIFLINLSSLAKAASKPAYALGAFILILITGSIFSHEAFSSAKPSDSLYIARIISEKAKLNTMFNSEERNKLAVQFATEHAQDISAVLANPEFNNDNNKDQVAKLNESFNEEIKTVKNRISYLKPRSVKNNEISEEASTFSMANSLKDKEGIQLAEVSLAPATSLLKATTSLLTDSATTTLKLETDNVPDKKVLNADDILDEATELFEKKDYNKALDKLKEVDEIIK